METQDPKPASTVVLCKITTDWPYKILLVQRSNNVRFLPGAHVFPGGRIEENDADFAQWLGKDRNNLLRMHSYFNVDYDLIAMHLSAAIRETLEEVGISILSTSNPGQQRNQVDPALLRNLLNNSDALTLLEPNLDTIWPISWWITPLGEVRRYDTWFFLALVQNDQDVITPPDGEISEPLWLYAKEALALYDNLEIFLAPPTRAILERMAMCSSLNEFLSFVDRPLWPIEPIFVHDGQDKALVLPGDSAHHSAQKSSLLLHTRYIWSSMRV